MGSATVPVPYRVTSSRQETEDTWTLGLEAAEPGGGLEFEPGQFTMLYAFGAGEVPISVSGDPGSGKELIHTIRAVGGVTESLCALGEGEIVGVRGPFGRGWPLAAAEGNDLVLIAGGLGLAPLRPALYAALAARDRFRRMIVLYGGRSPGELLFRDELAGWTEGTDLELRITVDAAGQSWRGRVGVVPGLIASAGLEPERTFALACGPEVMMRYSINALTDAGVPAEQVFVSLERNMRCAVGHCGHCQFGPTFVCRDGPVFSWPEVRDWFAVREL